MKKIITGIVAIILVVTVLIPISNLNQDIESKPTLDVFVLAGQSNSAYTYGTDVGIAQENPSIDNGYAFYYGDVNNPIIHHYGDSIQYDPTFESYSIQSMTNPDGTWRIGGIDSALASQYVSRTDSHCLIINAGINGISILGYSNPNGEGWSYTEDVLEDCFSKIDREQYRVNPCALFWIQGEADRSRDVDIYVDNFKSFWNWMKMDYGFEGAYLIDVRDGRNTNIAHQILADSVSSIHYVDSVSSDWENDSPNMTHDTIHYNQYGKNIIGEEFISAYLVDNPVITPLDVSYLLVHIIPVLVLLGIPIGLFVFRNRRT